MAEEPMDQLEHAYWTYGSKLTDDRVSTMADRQLDLSTSLTRTLSGETDAQVWAREFYATFRGVQIGDALHENLLVWFANAIESGREAGRQTGYREGFEDGKEAGAKVAWRKAQDLAAPYVGEGSHPLARHRDSMG